MFNAIVIWMDDKNIMHETCILECNNYESIDWFIDYINNLAAWLNLQFKPDSTLFGGYWCDPVTKNCIVIEPVI